VADGHAVQLAFLHGAVDALAVLGVEVDEPAAGLQALAVLLEIEPLAHRQQVLGRRRRHPGAQAAMVEQHLGHAALGAVVAQGLLERAGQDEIAIVVLLVEGGRIALEGALGLGPLLGEFEFEAVGLEFAARGHWAVSCLSFSPAASCRNSARRMASPMKTNCQLLCPRCWPGAGLLFGFRSRPLSGIPRPCREVMARWSGRGPTILA